MQNYRIERTSQGICCSILDPRGGGGSHEYFFDRMLVREQISTAQKNRMTLISDPKK